MTSRPIDKLYSLKEQGVEHLNTAKYQQATIYFKDILDRFESSIDDVETEEQMEKVVRELKLATHKNLTLCYLKLQKYQLCVKECRTAMEIQPNNIKLLYRIGFAYLQLKNYVEAQKYFKKGFSIDPQEKEIMKGLEQIQTLKNIEKTNTIKAGEPGYLRKIIALIISIIFCIPLMMLEKGKAWLQTRRNEQISGQTQTRKEK